MSQFDDNNYDRDPARRPARYQRDDNARRAGRMTTIRLPTTITTAINAMTTIRATTAARMKGTIWTAITAGRTAIIRSAQAALRLPDRHSAHQAARRIRASALQPAPGSAQAAGARAAA